MAGVIDQDRHWSGGRTHLVQLGDVVDRGPDSRKALDFLMSLEKEAAAAGGQVHALIGNHEVMRMLSDMRYVTPGEYAAFATPDSAATREEIVNRQPENIREQLMKELPLGSIEMRRAFLRAGAVRRMASRSRRGRQDQRHRLLARRDQPGGRADAVPDHQRYGAPRGDRRSRRDAECAAPVAGSA